MNKRHNKYFSILLIFCIAIVSCKKFVQIPDAKNMLPTSTIFTDSAGADAAVLGLYINVMQNSTSFKFLNGANTVYGSLASDELISNTNIPDEGQFYANKVLPDNGGNGNFWRNAYYSIYQANACMEGVDASSGISDASKKKLIGEAKFVRAFCYFHLVNFYGGVPLVLNTNYKQNAMLARASVDECYQQITNDLLSAKDALSEDYITTGRVRPNKYTAEALLSRIYLYQKQWQKAIDESTLLINSGIYFLETDINRVFLAGSQETIWSMIPLQPGMETSEGVIFVPRNATTKPKYFISNYLLNSFAAEDMRLSNWIKFNTVGGVNYYFPYKYKLGSDANTTPVENYIVFRLAEQYLIRAEARAQNNDLENAKEDLDVVRSRAGLGNIDAADQGALLDSVYHERQNELFCEWGHRWYDLKRTDKANTVMPDVTASKGGTWDANWQVFPIPFEEIKSNPFLKQNSGYQ